MKGLLDRAANAVLCVLFLFAVAVQYNDPDPIRWMAMYGSAAVCCLLALIGRLPRILPAAVGLVALVWAVVLGASVVRGNQPLNSEEGRETMGLVIVAFWMALLRSPRRGPAREPAGSR